MNIASTIVISVLFWCFWFFISLPFGVEREAVDENNFGGIKRPNILYKIVFATIMAFISASIFYYASSSGFFSRLIDI